MLSLTRASAVTRAIRTQHATGLERSTRSAASCVPIARSRVLVDRPSSNPIADDVRRLSTELEQVLRDNTALPALERLVGTAPEDAPFRNRHRNEALFQLRQVVRTG